jgi:predicted lactoylglutathione lyase
MSKVFFNHIGFSFNDKFGNSDVSAGLLIGERNVIVMLFEESTFSTIAQNNVTNTWQSNEVLLSVDAESKYEVDEMARKAEEAGGTIFSPPAEHQGWMYSCGFADLDGHRWNVLYMDMSKMQG